MGWGLQALFRVWVLGWTAGRSHPSTLSSGWGECGPSCFYHSGPWLTLNKWWPLILLRALLSLSLGAFLLNWS